MSRALRAMSCLASYNTTVIVITAVVSALLSLIGVMCILLATVPSRESLPSLISTVVLLSALSFGLVKTAFGRSGRGRQAKECSCIWATCLFSTLATKPLEYRHVRITQKDGAVDWTPIAEVCNLSSACFGLELEKTCPCCLDDFQPDSKVAVLPCRHMFHERCIVRWSLASAAKGPWCPTCRKTYQTSGQLPSPTQLGRSSV
ncbi:Iru [Symbiodinium microadriaticum]|nr:Iru [Symbiodinium microadriaticum]